MVAGSLDLDHYKLSGSEKAMKRRFLIIGFLMFVSMMHVGYASEYKQGIQVSLFMTFDELVTNVDFYFVVPSVPINLSSPAFDHLERAVYMTKRWLNQKLLITLTLRYSEETDESKAYQAAQEFLRVFNHSSLQLLSGPTNATTEFTYTFGYLEENLQTVKNFLKFIVLHHKVG